MTPKRAINVRSETHPKKVPRSECSILQRRNRGSETNTTESTPLDYPTAPQDTHKAPENSALQSLEETQNVTENDEVPAAAESTYDNPILVKEGETSNSLSSHDSMCSSERARMGRLGGSDKTKALKARRREISFIRSDDSFRIIGKDILENDKEIYLPIEVISKLWDVTKEGLPDFSNSMRDQENSFFMDYESSHIGDTIFLIEFIRNGLGDRYTCQDYKGISTWYITTWDGPIKSQYISHPFYNKVLALRPGSVYVTLERIMRDIWEQRHQNCCSGHFSVNIYLHGNPNDTSCIGSKFTTHRVCGGAMVADLFHVMQGTHSNSKNSTEKIEGWCGLGEIIFDQGTYGELKLRVNGAWTYNSLRKDRTMIKDMEWFKEGIKGGRDFVWLTPYI